MSYTNIIYKIPVQYFFVWNICSNIFYQTLYMILSKSIYKKQSGPVVFISNLDKVSLKKLFPTMNI